MKKAKVTIKTDNQEIAVIVDESLDCPSFGKNKVTFKDFDIILTEYVKSLDWNPLN
jgi:hypothetical protein